MLMIFFEHKPWHLLISVILSSSAPLVLRLSPYTSFLTPSTPTLCDRIGDVDAFYPVDQLQQLQASAGDHKGMD
jgi:hypothetical protein